MRRPRVPTSLVFLRSLVFASPVLLLPPAAAVEKCVAPDGKITYQERCPPGARSAPITGGTSSYVTPGAGRPADGAPGVPASTAAAILSTPPAGVDIQYYDVQGRDLRSLNASLKAINGANFHADAHWRLSYQYQARRQPGGGCGVASLDTRLELAMRFPRWSPPPEASAETVTRWQRYVVALRVHEEGHLEHGRSAEREFKAVAATLVAPDCEALKAELQARYQRVTEGYGRRDKEYDAKTGHGRTQGAVLN